MAMMPRGEVSVLRRYIAADGIECEQWEQINLAEMEGKEDQSPDHAKIKDSLGVSSQAKGQNISGQLMERILGIALVEKK